MAGVTARVFGVLLLIFGIMLLLAGSAAFIAGSVDSQQYEEDRNAFNRDQDREMAHDAAMTGGIAAAGVGFLVTVLGVVLLVAQRDGAQQQQQVVLSEATGDGARTGKGKGTLAQQQQRKPIVVGGAVAGSFLVIVLAVLAAGLAGEGPAAPLIGEDGALRQVGQASDSGTINAVSVGGQVVGQAFSTTFAARSDADLTLLQFEMDGDQTFRLIVTENDRIVLDEQVGPGGQRDFDGLHGEVGIQIEPMPGEAAQDVDVFVQLRYYR